MTDFTKDDPKCAAVEQRLREARAKMLRRGIQPLVKADGEDAKLRPAWQRIVEMGEREPHPVVQMKRRKA